MGTVVDESLEGEVHVTVIATGFDNGQQYKGERSSVRNLASQASMQQKSEPQDNGARIPEFLRQRQQQAGSDS